MASITLGVELTPMHCGVCGGTYAINEAYRQHKYEKGESWTCPYCKTGWGYRGNGEIDKLRKELQQERQRRDQAEAEARGARAEAEKAKKQTGAARKQTARLKKRVAAGVCPCCHRHFTNVERHIHAKHPDFATEAK